VWGVGVRGVHLSCKRDAPVCGLKGFLALRVFRSGRSTCHAISGRKCPLTLSGGHAQLGPYRRPQPISQVASSLIRSYLGFETGGLWPTPPKGWPCGAPPFKALKFCELPTYADTGTCVVERPNISNTGKGGGADARASPPPHVRGWGEGDPSGPLGSSSSQHRWTLEIVL
jgi:hypothetical protein